MSRDALPAVAAPAPALLLESPGVSPALVIRAPLAPEPQVSHLLELPAVHQHSPGCVLCTLRRVSPQEQARGALPSQGLRFPWGPGTAEPVEPEAVWGGPKGQISPERPPSYSLPGGAARPVQLHPRGCSETTTTTQPSLLGLRPGSRVQQGPLITRDQTRQRAVTTSHTSRKKKRGPQPRGRGRASSGADPGDLSSRQTEAGARPSRPGIRSDQSQLPCMAIGPGKVT